MDQNNLLSQFTFFSTLVDTSTFQNKMAKAASAAATLFNDYRPAARAASIGLETYKCDTNRLSCYPYHALYGIHSEDIA